MVWNNVMSGLNIFFRQGDFLVQRTSKTPEGRQGDLQSQLPFLFLVWATLRGHSCVHKCVNTCVHTTKGDFWLGYSAMSSGCNSFANRLSSFSYVDSYIFRPQLLWRTTQPVERYILCGHICVHGLVGRSVWSGRNFTPHT